MLQLVIECCSLGLNVTICECGKGSVSDALRLRLLHELPVEDVAHDGEEACNLRQDDEMMILEGRKVLAGKLGCVCVCVRVYTRVCVCVCMCACKHAQQ